MLNSPAEVAQVLERDFGLERGIAYAERIHHPDYREAAEILRERLRHRGQSGPESCKATSDNR